MDDETANLLRSTVRHLVATVSGPGLVAELDAAGWPEIVADDAATRIGVLFGEIGAARATSTALDAVVLGALGLPAGTTRVLYPDPLRHGAGPEGDTHVGLALGGWSDEVGSIVVLGDEPPTALVVAAARGRHAATPVAGIDPDLGLTRVELTVGAADGSTSEIDASAAWSVGRRALAHEILGVCQAMLELAQEHVGDRHQFGQPIGSFQAVRHHLANAYVAMSVARAAGVDAGHSGGAIEAQIAKALAGRAAVTTGASALQVMGGMGFTWEHPLHLYLRRTMALNVLLGSADVLGARLGRTILREGTVPRVGTF